MTPLTLPSLLQSFKDIGYQATIQEETQQIYFPIKIETIEFPFFARILPNSTFVQLITFLPCQLKKESLGDLARLLHLLNKELDMPGFGMDEMTGVAFYRLMVPLKGKHIDNKDLKMYTETAQNVCKTFGAVAVTVAIGDKPFDDILKEISQQNPQSQK